MTGDWTTAIALWHAAYPGLPLAGVGILQFFALSARVGVVRDKLHTPYTKEVQEADDQNDAGRQAEFCRAFPAISGMWPTE